MARPLRSAAELLASATDFNRLGRAWGGEHFAPALARALRAAGLLTGAHAATTVKRYAAGERVAPQDVMQWLAADIARRPRWLIGKTDKGGAAIAHLHQPRCVALIGSAGPLIEWIDPWPGAFHAGRIESEILSLMADHGSDAAASPGASPLRGQGT